MEMVVLGKIYSDVAPNPRVKIVEVVKITLKMTLKVEMVEIYSKMSSTSWWERWKWWKSLHRWPPFPGWKC